MDPQHAMQVARAICDRTSVPPASWPAAIMWSLALSGCTRDQALPARPQDQHMTSALNSSSDLRCRGPRTGRSNILMPEDQGAVAPDAAQPVRIATMAPNSTTNLRCACTTTTRLAITSAPIAPRSADVRSRRSHRWPLALRNAVHRSRGFRAWLPRLPTHPRSR